MIVGHTPQARHPPFGLTNLPGQWLQRQANGSNETLPASQGLEPESPGQNLASTVLCVPYSVDSGSFCVNHSKPLSIT